MQYNPWKLATIGLALMGTTALGAGLTTAWVMRPATAPNAQEPASAAPAPLARMTSPSPAYASRPATTRPEAPARVTRAATPVATVPTSTASTAECGTNGDRVMRIAKPGLIGGLLGAGVGAATGAIANGGKAAGKGALIGGLAGTAVGAGYGAYQTKNECGSVFNSFSGDSAPTIAPSGVPTQAAFADGEHITVYNAR